MLFEHTPVFIFQFVVDFIDHTKLVGLDSNKLKFTHCTKAEMFCSAGGVVLLFFGGVGGETARYMKVDHSVNSKIDTRYST